MRHFTSVKDLGDLNAALKEAFAVKADRFAYQHLGKNKTLNHDIFQFEPPYAPQYPESCNEFGDERYRARYKSGGLETRNRTGCDYGR